MSAENILIIKKTRNRKSKPPYECTRCGYSTQQKRDMRKHLQDLKKICPALENDIELTDEIRKKILENRIYKIPKEIKYIKPIPIIEDNILINEGLIYLYYPRACKNVDESVYKIGKTYDYSKREAGYMKGGDMLFVVSVTNRHECENIVKRVFQIEFKQRKDYGTEYFEGDVFEMVMTIKDCLSKYITKTQIEFKLL